MSEPIKLKLHDTDEMVEIPIGQMKHYENRVELDIVLKTHTMAKNEDESGLLAEEVIHQLVGILKDRLVYDDYAPYGVEILNWATFVHDTEIAKEEE